MAFPVPDHLPKRQIPVDVSSEILYKVDSATKETLNASLASSWIRELDESIQATKERIHERIQSELPEFQRKLDTSKSVQIRYDTLTRRVRELEDSLTDTQTTVVKTLSKHSSLAQDESDAAAVYEAFSGLLERRNAYISLTSLVQVGQLPEAVTASEDLENLVNVTPESLKNTPIAQDLKKKLNATKARVQDQLSDAYSRSIVVSATEILIHPRVQVRDSETILALDTLLHSLSPISLANHLSTLRRDLVAHYVDHILKQPYSVSVETSHPEELKLTLIPAPLDNEDISQRLTNLSTILNFLFDHLFPKLPQTEAVQFTRSLSKPITSSVLNNLLMPSLPSSFGLLPSFLSLIKHAVTFEEKDIHRLLESDRNERSIKAWSDGISGHYERRRRVDILEQTRKEIISTEDPTNTFQAFSEGGPETSLPTVVPVQDEDMKADDAWGFDEPATATVVADDKNGWGFGEPGTPNPPEDNVDSWGFDEPTSPNATADGADSWGFDEDEPTEEPALEKKVEEQIEHKINGDAEPDPDDAWGWNEGEEATSEDIPEENAWDDPWADSLDTNADAPVSAPQPFQAVDVVSPKAATRLEKKFASKNKKHLNGHSNSNTPLTSTLVPESTQATIVLSPPSPETQPPDSGHPPKGGRHIPLKRPAAVVTAMAPKEQYQVPKRTKRVVKMVETVIDESKLFYASNLFPEAKDMVPAPGSILSQSASSILDLYQALYPVKHAKELEDPVVGMLFSNSCLYMTSAVQRVEDTLYGQSALKDRLTECRHHLQVLTDSWFDETVDKQQQAIYKILVDGAQGFMYTSDQERFDDCEMAVNTVLQTVKRLAQRLKGILTKTKYYKAIGLIANAALSKVLQDVLALPDIPELESHRLSELCHILTALEGLFSENEASFVGAYVPNWFKFSYLSELLAASLADITYLFEQGALVDFQVDELVNLVRALFSDSALRTTTINKLLSGHPPSPS